MRSRTTREELNVPAKRRQGCACWRGIIGGPAGPPYPDLVGRCCRAAP